LVNKIEKRIRKHHVVTPELESEIKEITNSMYVKKHEIFYATETEKATNWWRADHDSVPELINNIHHLKIDIKKSAQLFDLNGDIELDHGYSFSYQITVEFPPYFQRQVIKS